MKMSIKNKYRPDRPSNAINWKSSIFIYYKRDMGSAKSIPFGEIKTSNESREREMKKNYLTIHLHPHNWHFLVDNLWLVENTRMKN